MFIFWDDSPSLNLSLDKAGKHRLLQLQELLELRHDTYKKMEIDKERTKAFHERFGYITLTLSFFQVSCAHDGTVLTWL